MSQRSYRGPAYTGCLALPPLEAAPSPTLAPLSWLVWIVLRIGRNQVVGPGLAPYRRFPERNTGGGANADCDGEWQYPLERPPGCQRSGDQAPPEYPRGSSRFSAEPSRGRGDP